MVKYLDESIFIDFEYVDGEIPEGFRAFFEITKDDNVLKSGELSLSSDYKRFELRITSGELVDLAPDSYKLKVYVEDSSIGYKDYIFIEDLILRS